MTIENPKVKILPTTRDDYSEAVEELPKGVTRVVLPLPKDKRIKPRSLGYERDFGDQDESKPPQKEQA